MPAIVDNPTTVANANYDTVWESSIRVIEKYFVIGYENRYDGRIETLPLASATILEPWRHDAVGFRQRVEASLQTIRRRGFFLIQPSPAGGFVITVEVYKELENLVRPAYAQFGGGTFITSLEPVTESLVTTAIKPTDGWIAQGRDLLLEAKIIADLQEAIDRRQVSARVSAGEMEPTSPPAASAP